MADRMNRTPLHYAAVDGSLDEVLTHLTQGADVNAREVQDYTPLHFAAQQAYLEIVKVLLDSGAEVNAQNVHGKTPLGVVIMTPGPDAKLIARELLARGANPDLKAESGKSPRDVVGMMVNQELKDIFAEYP